MHFSDFTFNLINGLAGYSNLLDYIMVSISKLGPYILMAATIIVYLIGIFKKNKELRTVAAEAVFKTAVAYSLSQLISCFASFNRPFVNKEVNLLYEHDANNSFPSDHSLGCMSLALGLGKYKYKISIDKCFYILAVAVGVSRVYVGHHYPLDVLGGFILALLISNIYEKHCKDIIRKIYFKLDDLVFKHIMKIY